MGKYTSESNENINVGVGEVAFLQNDSYDIQKKGDRYYCKANLTIDSNYFSDELLQYYKESTENIDSIHGGPTAMTSETDNHWNVRPYFKLQSYQKEVTMGGYTYAACGTSGVSGDSALTYLRFDPATKSAQYFKIKYTGGGNLTSMVQSNASMILTGNGSKLFAYFLANSLWQCYTSTDGVNWTDETASFSLSAILGSSNVHTVCDNSHDDINAYNGTRYDSTHRFITMTWCGSAFLLFGNDATNCKLWSSTDGLTWTDVSSTFGLVDDVAKTVKFVANVYDSGKVMFMGRQFFSGLFGAYSTDGGLNWSSSTNNQDNIAYDMLYKNPLDENKYIAKIESSEGSWAITQDGGATWNNLTFDFSTYSSDGNTGFAYFGNYIYAKNKDVYFSNSPIMVSSDNGSTWDYLEGIPFDNYYKVFNDDYRLYIATGKNLYYSTNGVDFLYRDLQHKTNNAWKGAVSIDANKTVFLSESNVNWMISSDGCVTIEQIFKRARSGLRDFSVLGLNLQEIGYLPNAKMIATTRAESTSTTETNSYWTDWIFNPVFVQLQNASAQTGTELTPFIRTK